MASPYSVQHILNNQNIDNPVERIDTSVQVNFDENAQGSVETDTFTFVNEAFTILDNAIKNGLNGGNGIFEGLKYDINIQQGQENENIFKGFVDMKSIENLYPAEPKILAKVIKEDGIDNISERLEGLTFALLEATGNIKSSDYVDVKTIIEKKVTFIEQALLALSIYLMVKEIIEAAYRIADIIATISSITSSSLTGAVGALIYAIASLIFEAAYVALMIKALFTLVEEFVNNLIPPTKELKGITLITGLKAIFKYLGYKFISPIKELEEYVYMPSKADGRENKGIPFDSDYGFTASEFVNTCLTMFQAKIFVQKQTNGGSATVQLRSDSDAYFLEQSTYILPDVLVDSFGYNTDQLKESVLISFKDDISDEYTIDNWKGTSYVVTTKPKTFTNEKAVQITSFLEKRIQLSLGSRKESLSSLENALNDFFSVANDLFGVFGASNTFPQLLERVGLLKVSNQFFNNPKILKVKNGKLPDDYRDSLSAKYLWENYINYNSFVGNNYNKQRKVFTGVRIPFSYADYKKVLNNSYFTTSKGQTGKFVSLNWVIESDFAEVDYWIQETYTKNLKEEFYEVS